MEHKNVVAHDGKIHDGLFQTHGDALIHLNCGASRYEIVRHYEPLDPARITTAALTCGRCRVVAEAEPEVGIGVDNVTRAQAEAVLMRADVLGERPSLDGDGIRRAFAALGFVEPLCSGVHGVIVEHLVMMLAERAMTVPPGTPEVRVTYHCYNGGEVEAPVSVGDRLMHDGICSGNWDIVTVAAIEEADGEVSITVEGKDGVSFVFDPAYLKRWYSKLDR